ncbi:CcdB family protein [Brevundimonas sp. TWP2-3-2]|uniref:CcdB family protein n=1 Tax=unclassified Brevundimonas TaxID=2622653 RepID=UPI003CF8C63A
MRQFDFFENPSPEMRQTAPYLVVLSSHLFADLSEVVVAPVVRPNLLTPSDFDVPVVVDEERHLVSVIGLAAISSARLKRRVGSLLAHEDDIRRALDLLFTGF